MPEVPDQPSVSPSPEHADDVEGHIQPLVPPKDHDDNDDVEGHRAAAVPDEGDDTEGDRVG